MSLRRLLVCLACVGVAGLVAQPAAAQDDEGWSWIIAPYLLMPHMNGNTNVNGVEAEVDVGPSDIFSNLDFGMMLYLETYSSDWTVAFDFLYMNIGQEGVTPVTMRDVDVSLKQSMFELSGMRRLSRAFEVGVGGRVNTIDMGLEVAPGETLPGTEAIKTETWFDPFIVARLMAPWDGPWRLGIRGDIGGLIGSDYAWQVYPFLGYRFGRTFELALAYRAMGMKYEDGEGSTLFEYDMRIFGPEVGILLHF